MPSEFADLFLKHPYLAVAAFLLFLMIGVALYYGKKFDEQKEKEDVEALADLAEIQAREKLGPCEGCHDFKGRCCG